MERSLISVVIPHYNSENTIQRAISSVLNQTVPAFEIIVVDDCSSLESYERLKALLREYQNIKLYRLTSNGGPASARNFGWDKASGDWVAFLDSDDAWHPQKSEIQLNQISNYGDSVSIIGSAVKVLENGSDGFMETTCSSSAFEVVTLRDLLIRNRFATPTVMIRAESDFRFSEGRRYSEDFELWLRIVASGNHAIRVNTPLAFLFKRPFSESGLSSHLYSMSLGELQTFQRIYASGLITFRQLVFASSVSVVKSARRYVLSLYRRLK